MNKKNPPNKDVASKLLEMFSDSEIERIRAANEVIPIYSHEDPAEKYVIELKPDRDDISYQIECDDMDMVCRILMKIDRERVLKIRVYSATEKSAEGYAFCESDNVLIKLNTENSGNVIIQRTKQVDDKTDITPTTIPPLAKDNKTKSVPLLKIVIGAIVLILIFVFVVAMRV